MYLIDGNNVMGQRVGWHRDKPAAQRRLLREVSEKVLANGEEAIVVFDGRPLPDVNDGGLIDGVAVFFARPGSDADHRIVELAEAVTDRSEIVAVTSDRLLADSLRLLGVRIMRSGRFRKMLEDGT